MAEKEQEHRHKQEEIKNHSDISLSKKGLAIGSLFEVSLIGGLVYSVFLDSLPGIITLGACVLALPVVFILRQSFKKISLFGNSIEMDDSKED